MRVRAMLEWLNQAGDGKRTSPALGLRVVGAAAPRLLLCQPIPRRLRVVLAW